MNMSFQTLRIIFTAVRSVAKPASKIPYCSKLISRQTHFENVQRCVSCSHFHTSSKKQDLSEFFENKENFGERKIYVGRPWKLDELRIKSNEDLHKLWYILLKERNMLMTMEAEYNRLIQEFPSPERIYKVEESMENILSVVKERNEAYNVLETGKTGEPGTAYIRNALGLHYHRRYQEHMVPKFMNKRYKLLHSNYEKWMGKYLALHAEKKRVQRKRQERRDQKFRKSLQNRFPHLNEEEIEFGVEQRRNRPY